MTRKSRERFLRPVAGLIFAAAISGVLADAQPPPALPNMGQDLSPLGTMQNLNPGLADFPNWLAGNAVTTVVSPASRYSAGSDERVQPRLQI